MTIDDALAGARNVAADLTNALHCEVQVSSSRSGDGHGSIQLEIPTYDIHMGFGIDAMTDTTVSAACHLARQIQDDVLARSGKIWPWLPGQGDQPLIPDDNGWRTVDDRAVLIPYGQVTAAKDPDPNLHGVIRWWLDYWFVGVIADQTGDIWFSEREFHGELAGIKPTQPVIYTVGEGQHGKYRKAASVRAG